VIPFSLARIEPHLAHFSFLAQIEGHCKGTIGDPDVVSDSGNLLGHVILADSLGDDEKASTDELGPAGVPQPLLF
jgi:hypothetical protein